MQHHHSPQSACECGIYATHTKAQALDYAAQWDLCIVGEVKLTGTVIKHAQTWRAERARISKLIVLARKPLDPAAHELAQQLQRVYGVPCHVNVDKQLIRNSMHEARRWLMHFALGILALVGALAMLLWMMSDIDAALAGSAIIAVSLSAFLAGALSAVMIEYRLNCARRDRAWQRLLGG